jgi:phosphomevalonate kinase
MRIALSGKRLSGKSTAARVLKDFGFYSVSFGDCVKDEVAEDHHVSVFDVIKNKEIYRQALQQKGESRRAEDPTHWIKQLADKMARADAQPYKYPHIVLDDLRYQNEAQWLRDNGWKLVRIDVNPYVLQERRTLALGEGYDTTPDLHISETDLDDWTGWDYTIHNDYSLDVFKTDVKEILASLLLDEVTDERNKWDLGIKWV